MRSWRNWVLVSALLAPAATHAEDCGGAAPCRVQDGSYRIEMPSTGLPKGALVFFHGYKSSAELQMQHRALVEVTHAHGLAFVAVDGLNGTWSHPNAPAQDRDERRFVGHVLDDLETRFGFSAANLLVGGFSQGASMAWYTLCQQGNRVAGAVTFSGVFWNPLPAPQDCVAAIPPLVHVHGTADQTFPLTGRAIGTRFHQGDMAKSIALLRERAQCGREEPRSTMIGGIPCTVTPDCSRGKIALCLHDGGHEIHPEHLDAALRELGF
ncbi:alpha/beta hydrolase family esterase [Rhizobium sp. YIM 134829]|uniref:alpha/beta hydrolase family esterase n=1 Tax=Rhizobium sp. YIM 134829 TaxID=3390453 RepID=UPI00397A02EF